MDEPDHRLPVSDNEAKQLFAHLSPFSSFILAVSGGPDSMALLHLFAPWAKAEGKALQVATVHHGLRADADRECAMVEQAAGALGLPWTQLNWRGDKPETGVQEAARMARYDLLRRLAATSGADCLVTAHHRDDQAETVLMRLCAGSGIAGLAGIAALSRLPGGLALARPFLPLPKQRLVDRCETEGWPFALDSTNRDPAYARSRYRALMPALTAEGLSPARLSRLAQRAARADAALEAVTDAAWTAAEPDILAKGGRIPARALLDHSAEITLRLIGRAIDSAAAYHGLDPASERLERLEALAEELQAAFAAQAAIGRTLRGVAVRLSAQGNIRFVPAAPRRVKADASNSPKIGG